MITKLMQEIEGEFNEKLETLANFGTTGINTGGLNTGYAETGEFTVDLKLVRDFLHSAQTRLLEGVVNIIESHKGDDFIITGINGEPDKTVKMNVYLDQLIYDIISKLQSDGN